VTAAPPVPDGARNHDEYRVAENGHWRLEKSEGNHPGEDSNNAGEVIQENARACLLSVHCQRA
jgi:hypothetical protein